MKKIVALSALASAMLVSFGASAADVTFSGTVRGAVDVVSTQKDSADNKNDLHVNVNRARLRMDAKQALDGGGAMNGFIRVHSDGNKKGGSNVAVDQAGITIAGGWGLVLIQGVGDSGGFVDAVSPMDIFETGALIDRFKQANSAKNAAAYVTPDMGGLRGKIAILTDDDPNPRGEASEKPKETHVDVLNLRATYSAGPVYVGVSYTDWMSNGISANEDTSRLGLAGSFTLSPALKISAAFEQQKAKDDTRTQLGLTLSGVMDKLGYRVGFATTGGDNGASGDAKVDYKGNVLALGGDYIVGKGAKVFGEVVSRDKDVAKSGKDGKDGSVQVQVGLKLDY